jgi:hypothetical protein
MASSYVANIHLGHRRTCSSLEPTSVSSADVNGVITRGVECKSARSRLRTRGRGPRVTAPHRGRVRTGGLPVPSGDPHRGCHPRPCAGAVRPSTAEMVRELLRDLGGSTSTHEPPPEHLPCGRRTSGTPGAERRECHRRPARGVFRVSKGGLDTKLHASLPNDFSDRSGLTRDFADPEEPECIHRDEPYVLPSGHHRRLRA